MADGCILYVDDEPAALATFVNNFRKEFTIVTAQTGSEALRLVEEQPVAVLVADQRMPEMHGVEVIERAHAIRPDIVPIMLTGYTDSDSLKDAINRAGVFRYLDKPWTKNDLGHALRRALDHHHLAAENARLARELREANERLRARNEALASENADLRRDSRVAHELVGEAPAVEQLRERIARAAPHRAHVLILGETGTGKEVVARAIHAASPRHDGPLLILNCSTIPRELVESELFGHVKGAFTGASTPRAGHFVMAEGGTLFLDEIGDLPLDLQPKLLRVLQEAEFTPLGSSVSRKVDVRVIAATNRDLATAVRDGTFRGDLYSRLNVVPIRVPPLRERRSDIPLLARHFLDIESHALFGRPAPRVTEAAMALLAETDFGANVRDLRNLVIRTLINHPDERELGEAEFVDGLDRPAHGSTSGAGGSYRERKDDAERRILEEALAGSRGNKRQAARDLGISEQGLHKAMKRLGMSADGDEEST